MIMNKITRKKVIYAILILAIIIAIFIVVYPLWTKKINQPSDTTSFPTPLQILAADQQQKQWQELARQDALLGSIATSTDGKEMIYINNKYKFTFRYPIDWILGGNWFGNGGIQLLKDTYYTDNDNTNIFNYSYNYKIEIGIGQPAQTNPNNKDDGATTLTINGVKVRRYDDKTEGKYNKVGGVYIRHYIIPLQSDTTYSLGITMYNFSTTTSDFTVLDNIVKSIRWLP